MNFENLNEGLFEPISNEQMEVIQGGLLSTTSCSGVHNTGGCGCQVDCDDIDGPVN